MRAAVAVMPLLLLLMGCAGTPAPDSSTAEADPAPSMTMPVSPSADDKAVPPDESLDDDAYMLEVLYRVDPNLTTDRQRALDRVQRVCGDIRRGTASDVLLRNTEQRFEGGRVDDVTPEQAATIVDAVRAHWC